MSESRERKSGAILSYVSIIVNTIIQLLYTPLLIRMLGQSEYGLYSLVASIIGYLTILDLGFGNAIIVYTAKYRAQGKYEEEKKLHGMFKKVFIVIGIIASILGIILYFNVGNIFGKTMNNIELEKMKIMMLILSFNLMITFVFNIYSCIISAYEKFIFQKLMAIISSLLKPLIMIPLLFIGFKSIAMCIVITIVNVIVLSSNYLYCKKKLKITTKYKGFDKIIFKTILGYSIWIFLGIIVDKVNYSIDNFVLGAISGTAAVAIYALAATIDNVFINLSAAISSVSLPKITKLIAKNASNEELTDEMIKIGRVQNYIIFLVCSGFILFGKIFIEMWVGKKYMQSYYVTLLLIIPACVPLIQNTGLSIMQAKNKYRFKTITTSIMSIFNLIISIYLAKKWGPVGAALGTCIAIVTCNIIIINIYYLKKLNLNIIRFWKSIIRQTIPFVIPITLIYIIEKIINLSGAIGFIIYGTIYVAIYCVVAYKLSFNKYEKELVTNVIKKIKKIKVRRKAL